jgi:hypothetical protein
VQHMLLGAAPHIVLAAAMAIIADVCLLLTVAEACLLAAV